MGCTRSPLVGGWTVQFAVLGVVHIVACGLVYSGVAVGDRRLIGSRPRTAGIIGRVSGIALIVVAVALVLERPVAM